MRVEVFFGSNKGDGASTKSYFKIPFEWSAIPPDGTETAVPVESNRGMFVLKGVLQDVRITGSVGKILFGTDTSPQDMREAVLPGKLRLQEMPTWLD